MTGSKTPHIPAETWLVEWQYRGAEKLSQSCLTRARSDALVFRLMGLKPAPRVWQAGAIVCNGADFD